jgi:hypothetical protein
MKSLTLRSSIALACALSVAGCGGGGGDLLLEGSVAGLSKSGLVLQNNGADPLVVAAGTQIFTFAGRLENDQDFDVTVKTQPTGAVCTVTNGKGRTSTYSINSVVVRCITDTYELGGTISGLDRDGLVLANGPERTEELKAGATTFTMTRNLADGSYYSGKVPDGAPYGVTVLTQPPGRTCSVTNGVGTMGSAAVTGVQVKCA